MGRIVGILVMKVGSRPLGIWIAWLGLAYVAAANASRLFALADLATVGRQAQVETIATWAIIVAAIVALVRRRLIARMLIGMAMTLLFFQCLDAGDRAGMLLAALVIPCLLANRRWFDEKLPWIGW